MKKDKISLLSYDRFPEAMLAYLQNYGFHFNKKACDFAVSFMMKDEKPIDKMTKPQVDTLLTKQNIKIENNVLYDACYIANMAKADFYGSSIDDDQHLAQFIKDYVDDEDQPDGFIFNRWYADMMLSGNPIDWEALL